MQVEATVRAFSVLVNLKFIISLLSPSLAFNMVGDVVVASSENLLDLLDGLYRVYGEY